MIQFPCHCGRPIEVSDDEAGGVFQCPDCCLLNDVPSLADLANMEADGTIRAAGKTGIARPDFDRLAELSHIFGRNKTDDKGRDIDLRPAVEDLAVVGMGAEIPINPAVPPRIYAPMYDPETGELVRPIELADVPAQPAARRPRPAVASPGPIDYAHRGRGVAPIVVPILQQPGYLQLLRPANVVVMAIIFFAHLLGGLFHLVLLAFAGYVYAQTEVRVPVWPFNLLFWLAVAHYANVIQDVGPETHEDLPRPLRFAGLMEDILAPLFRVLTAVLVCYLPMFLALQLPPIYRYVTLPIMLGGAAFFPAVLLTTAASGSLSNLRPDRVAKVILHSGPKYFALAGLWLFLFPLYLWAALGIDLIGDILDIDVTGQKWAGKLFVALPTAMAAVFLGHLFCWELAMIYREKHDRFGWAWQEHLREIEERRRQRAAEKQARARHATARLASEMTSSFRTPPE